MTLRRVILETAASTEGVGEIEEALKWGEPAYLTTKSKSGSTIRIDWKESNPSQYGMFFNCRTTLVDTFRTLYPTEFKYEGNRSIVFDENDAVPVEELSFCVAAALTYHRKKKASRGQGAAPATREPSVRRTC